MTSQSPRPQQATVPGDPPRSLSMNLPTVAAGVPPAVDGGVSPPEILGSWSVSMAPAPTRLPADSSPDASPATDFMILADGTIYARNLTPDLARMLADLNPHDATMAQRAASAHP